MCELRTAHFRKAGKPSEKRTLQRPRCGRKHKPDVLIENFRV
jgi:hypothetical protein